MILSTLISCVLLSSSTLDLREYSSTPNSFKKVEKHILCQKPKVVILTKAKLSEEDIARFEALVNRNDMKGTKLVDTDGEQIGSLITDWHTYNLKKEAAGDIPPVKTTAFAIAQFEKGPREVIDFGASTGNEVIQLIKMFPDIHVVAIDGDEEATTILKKRIPPGKEHQVTVYTGPFIQYKGNQADLLIASFVFPYRSKEDFPTMWNHAVSLIKDGGIVAGQFFGEPANPKKAMTYHDEQSIKALLKDDFEILFFQEDHAIKVYGTPDEEGKVTPMWGELYHVVARKKRGK